ncbi:spore morphogenesis/germination protein YwcE [Bacillus taeanensis]|uniref:Uncharacterized protein n=1 Tax=Bacillus taeanensis TaxID=273032 RepID=A0A366XY59_9BACI|nr:spore morphogenesis/germination protein YwcE [Bacillus taeanensis]RBW69094.1 hypothetical protein DS031_13120 [Bacillus taeanensis]
MDIVIIFMLLSSLTPILLWRHSRHKLALIQIPFVVGMWAYFVQAASGNISHFILPVSFYGNLVFAEAAIILVFVIGRDLEKRKMRKNLHIVK